MAVLGLPRKRLTLIGGSSWLPAKGYAAWMALACALVLCFRSDGHHREWVLLALFVPFVRLLIDPPYRKAIQNRFRRYANDVGDFSRQGGKSPYEAILVLVVLPVAILNLLSNRTLGTFDTWPVMAASSSLVNEGYFEIGQYSQSIPESYSDPQTGLPYCVVCGRDGYFSSYPAGMNVFAVPVCAISRLLGADLSSPKVRWRLEKFTASWVTALCIGLFFTIALRLADPLTATIAAVYLASGSAMLSTVGHALWQHGGVIFWALLALVLEFHAREKHRYSLTLLQGIALGMMMSCRLSAGLVVGAMGLWIGVRSVPRGLILTAGIALGYLPWALFYESEYGSLLGPSQVQTAGCNWGGMENMASVLFSPAAGLLIYQPWIVFVLFLPILWLNRFRSPSNDRGTPSGWVWLAASIVAMHVILVAHWKCWWGGDCWGSRLCSEALPFAALLCLKPIAYLRMRRWGIVLLLFVAVASAYLHLYVTYFRDGFSRPVGELLDWSRPPFLPGR